MVERQLTVKTARELRNRVSVKFGKRSEVLSYPEHVVLYEVPFVGRSRMSAWGRPTRQRYDAVAIGIWPSSQRLVHGFELKVSRADLLHELRDLSKSEIAARNVDRFWLVLGDKTLMTDGDPIPESWGILAASGRGLRKLRDAAPQDGTGARDLLAGVATRALVSPRIGTEVRYRAGYANGFRDGKQTGYRAGRSDERQNRDWRNV